MEEKKNGGKEVRGRERYMLKGRTEKEKRLGKSARMNDNKKEGEELGLNTDTPPFQLVSLRGCTRLR